MPLNFVINFSKMSDNLLRDLSEIVEDNVDKLSEDDREEVEDIVADLKENLSKIVEHGERAISIIRGILLQSRGKYVWLSYHAMRANDKSFNISIHEDYQVDIPKLMVIPQDLSRAILNLMNNACYAVHKRAENEGDDYAPTINVKTSLADGMLTITIADNGEGMSDEVKQRLFENFFTTKPVGKGTGLGMAIVRDIVEQKHGGKLSFESTLGSGTIFTITIPEKKS